MIESKAVGSCISGQKVVKSYPMSVTPFRVCHSAIKHDLAAKWPVSRIFISHTILAFASMDSLTLGSLTIRRQCHAGRLELSCRSGPYSVRE